MCRYYLEIAKQYKMFRSFKKKSIKIVIIGDGAVGKTSYVDKFINEEKDDFRFKKNYNATTGCNVYVSDCLVNGKETKLHIFDTAGQEKFGSLRDSYVMGADGVILMYDITNIASKNNVIKRWLPNIRKIFSENGFYNVPIIVVGNKLDIRKKCEPGKSYVFRQCNLDAGYKNFGSIEQCLISVKSGENLMNPLEHLLKKIFSSWWDINIVRQ